jgi:membrane protease YdiL (CAAX protease family)
MLAAVLLSVHRNFGSMEFALRTFSQVQDLKAAVFMFAAASLLLGLVPLVVIVSLFREKAATYGLQLGDWKLGATFVLALFPIITIALLYPASQTHEMRAFYPLAKHASTSMSGFLTLEITRVVLFYTAWEFFFRGFMLFGLRPYVGDWLAICIQVIPQCLWHIGMPTGELLSSIAGGILFGIMAIRTNSLIWPLVLHSLIGITLDLFIVITS